MMTTLSTRDLFQSNLRGVRKDLRAMFEAMNRELAGLISSYTGADGKIPPDQLDELQRDSHAIIEKYFVTRRRVTPAEKQVESERLRELINTAQKQLKRATKRESFELRNRIIFLSKRLALLERQSVALDSIKPDGQPVSPYARIMQRHMKAVVSGVLEKHARLIKSILEHV